MLGSYVDGDAGIFARDGAGRPAAGTAGAAETFQADYRANGPDGKPLTFAEAKEVRMNEQLERRLKRTMFTVNIATGEIKIVRTSTDWLNHLQFSPTDPGLIMFCHEGPWHKIDRIWTIRTDGSALTKIHTRTMNMEIAGHEFFSADGKMIWYDLQTPRGEDFWVAGYELATGRRTWWHLQRDEWSVHFNVSPDGRLFAGDGGDHEMVAHAKDGKWIYLFTPQRIPDVAGIKNPESANLIDPGFFQSERLVNLSKHDYRLEPNVTFTPDMKWIVFRSNMTGVVHTYAVEIAKTK
jgi:oligogalacturonide lyase